MMMTAALRSTVREHLSIVDDYRSGMTLQQIADERGYSISRVHDFLKDAGVPRRKKGDRGGTMMRTPVLPTPRREQGFSKATKPKKNFFGTCIGDFLSAQERTSAWSVTKSLEWIDCNGSDGQPDKNGWKSSVVMFMDQIKKRRHLPVVVWFVEKNKKKLAALERLIREEYKYAFKSDSKHVVRFVLSDNTIALEKFLLEIVDTQSSAIGMLHDPFGWGESGGAVRLEVLKHFFRECPNASFIGFHPYARAKAARDVKGWGESRSLKDYVDLRPHGLVSEPVAQKIFLYGTPRSVREIDGTGHTQYWTRGWRFTSAKGKAILYHADTVHGTNEDKNSSVREWKKLKALLDS